jgi:CRAL/TRIO domain
MSMIEPSHSATTTTFVEIVNHPALFGNERDKIECEKLLEEFTDVEAEELARTSYAYDHWAVPGDRTAATTPATAGASPHPPPAGDTASAARRNAALKEIRRHYVGEGRNRAKTLAALREAMRYRKEYRIDLLRSCFYNQQHGDEYYLSPDDASLASKYRSMIVQDLDRQRMVVRGVDCHFRTIVYKPPRTSNPKGSEEAFLLAQLYTAERAIATSEFHTKGREEKLAVVFDFGDYNSSNTPSSSTLITLTKILQRTYPERLGVLVIVDPPFSMRVLFNVVWPFISKATAEKIKLASGKTAIDAAFRELVGKDDNLFTMLASSDIASSVDVTEYTRKPLYRRYDDDGQQ